MPDDTPVNETEQSEAKFSSSQSAVFDSRRERDSWGDLIYRVSKTEAEINLINRQLTEIKTDIKNLENSLNSKMEKLDSKIEKLDSKIEKLDSKMDRILDKFDTSISLSRNLSIGSIFAFVGVIVALLLNLLLK
ncbi:MAG: hypothetical protein LBW85_02505 [Deltaproteobacteria bacterium]|jgi:predicted  nucleic acid-binding Zn-ribbon protein|nr:hypothetical protein [Deltaproteobacteria bacterium]